MLQNLNSGYFCITKFFNPKQCNKNSNGKLPYTNGDGKCGGHLFENKVRNQSSRRYIYGFDNVIEIVSNPNLNHSFSENDQTNCSGPKKNYSFMG